MKIPKTTSEQPYIEFRFDKKGNMHLKAVSNWWGGKTSSFISSDGSEGDSCPPNELKSYIKAFQKRKEKAIEKEIEILKLKLEQIKLQNESFVF